MSLLTSKQITALTVAYKAYRLQGKIKRRAVETIFFAATGKKLGSKYYAIPIVRNLLELSS
jgi:hypothetical protein